MYPKMSKGIFKHFDFIAIDLICLELSYYISCLIRQVSMGLPIQSLFQQKLFISMYFILFFVQVIVSVFFDTFKNVLKRGYYKEAVSTLFNVALILLVSSSYLFITQQSAEYSRFIWLSTGALYFVSSYVSRLCWKIFLKKKMKKRNGRRSLLIITESNRVDALLHRLKEHNYEGFVFAGIVLLDQDRKNHVIDGIPVVANKDTVLEYTSKAWIDEVLLDLPILTIIDRNIIQKFTLMGITVHLNLDKFISVSNEKQFVEKISSYTVLTYSINAASNRQVILKRIMDIVGGVIGCIATLILTIIIGPIIYIQSPGPIFFKQERVGKNGKKFKLYKFRSMYMDAEKRKQELMAQNRVKDGLMFKMENDPRIIGSEKGPGKGIGNFIRKTSLDEFPQFWNVLKGEMSLVGTRPPTVDEFEKYHLHHRARLAIKPGITGMWQVNGRSNITDFEEVVKLDMDYIENWSIGMDLRLMLKTIGAVFQEEGSM